MSRRSEATRTGPRARAVLFALVLAALLALVALASSGELGSDARGDDGGGIPSGVYGYLYALFLGLGILAVPAFVFLFARETPYAPARRRRARMTPFFLLGVLGLLVFAASRWPEQFSTVIDRLSLFDGDDRGGAPGAPPAPERTPTAIVWGAIGGTAVLFLAWHVLRPRRGRLRPVPTLAETLADAIEETIADLHAEPDARRAIIRAYAAMEGALGRAGLGRDESEAPLEYLARVLLALDVQPEPVHRLTDLFEQAKFSDHAIDAPMKGEAIAALEAIRTDLRELA